MFDIKFAEVLCWFRNESYYLALSTDIDFAITPFFTFIFHQLLSDNCWLAVITTTSLAWIYTEFHCFHRMNLRFEVSIQGLFSSCIEFIHNFIVFASNEFTLWCIDSKDPINKSPCHRQINASKYLPKQSIYLRGVGALEIEF